MGGRAIIVIPTLNEAGSIASLIDLMDGQAPDRVAEIIVADGGSSDGTREIVAGIAHANPRVRLLNNPRRLQSAGVNLAAREGDAAASILIRVDAHAGYPGDFIPRLLDALEQSGGQSVVVPMHTVGRGCFQRAVAAVSNSVLGTGGAVHRVGGASGFVDHGHHAAFDRAAFLQVGGYDEAFATNEDAEFDARLRAGGGRIWFAGDIVIDYVPRATPWALARQYFRYGVGRMQNRRKHGYRLRLRQIVPPLLTLGVAASLVAALFWPPALLLAVPYAAAVLAGTLMLVVRAGSLCALLAAVALPIMHFSWGLGFLREAIRRR